MPQEQSTRESREECVARMLRSGASWRMIQEECGVSRSTISRIKRRIEGGDKSAAGSVLWDAELNAKAIELIEKGKARTPADLVKHLKIPIPQAVELFNAAATAMGMTVTDIVELLKKVDETENKVLGLQRGLDEGIRELHEIEGRLEGLMPLLQIREKMLRDAAKEAGSMLEEVKRVLNSEELREVREDAELAAALYNAVVTAWTLNVIAGLRRAVTCEHYDPLTKYCRVRKLVIGIEQKVGGGLSSVNPYYTLLELATATAFCKECPYYKPRSLESLERIYNLIQVANPRSPAPTKYLKARSHG